MSEFARRPGSDNILYRLVISFTVILLSITQFVSGALQDEILLIVHNREITKKEFLYYFHKNNQPINEATIKDFLKLFIDFQLKVAQATDERLYGNIGFITELTDYRKQLAAPYLTDKEKEEEFVNEAIQRLQSEFNASHILIRLDPGSQSRDTLTAYTHAMQIRDCLINGESFARLAIAESDDPLVAKDSGDLGYLTAFQTEYPFETAVFSLAPGEISMPVRTKSGYHIIKLNEKREASGTIMNEQEVKELIYKAKDKRAETIRNAFVEKLKSYWDFRENLDALEIIYELTDERVFKGNWIPPANQTFNDTLFYIDKKGLTQQKFIEFISDYETDNREMSIKEYIFSLYRQFVSSSLIRYENYKLEEKYPEFRFQLQEYRDAMLLEAITRKQVLSKAESDRAGMGKFYSDNIKNYMWGERLYADICFTSNKKVAERGARLIAKMLNNKDTGINQMLTQINTVNNKPYLTAKRGTFSRGDHPLIDQIIWKKGVSGIKQIQGKYQFAVVYDILKPEVKNLDEVYDTVFNDYKNYLMDKWIEELRNTYRVEINQEVLSSIK